MNKYQEALFRIRLVLRTNHDEKWLYNELNLLHKIVEKETPMKPTIDEFKHPYCPRCNAPLVAYRHLNNVHFDRCNNEECGQRIDWDNTQDTAL